MNTPNQYGAAHPAQVAQPFASAAARTEIPTSRTISDFRRFNNPLLSSLPVAEAVQKFIKAATELAASAASSGQYLMDVHSLSKGDSAAAIYCSAVILVVRNAQNPNAGLAYHVMLLSDTAEDPAPVFINQPGLQGVEIFRVMSDAYDDEYRAVVYNLLRTKYPQITDKCWYDAEAEVIPKGYDFNDLNMIRRTLINAGNAVTTQLNSADPEFVDVSLEAMSQLPNTQVRLAFNQPQTANEVNDPVRTDVSIDYLEVTGTGNQGKNGVLTSLNSGEQTTRLASIKGYLDLVWSPVGHFAAANPYAPASPYMQQPQTPPYLYQPRFIITRVELPIVTTLPMELLALTPALALRDNLNWMPGFHRPHGAEFDMHDIGAIGIEVNANNNPNGIGDRFDTRADSFKEANLGQLLQAFVRPDLAISMDIDEYGPTTWRDSIFLAAARGFAPANRAIINACDMLTNGHFSKIYQGPVVMDDNNRLHTGWYADNKGEKVDLRNVDHLCVLNMLGEKDPAAARDWSDTFAQNQYPIEQRLQVRRRILSAVLRDVHITGYAQRITFYGEFLKGLAQALAAAGLQIRLQNPYQDMTGQPRASASWLDQGAITGPNMTVFQRGFAPQPGQVMGGAPQVGRWR